MALTLCLLAASAQDALAQSTSRVSVATGGAQGNASVFGGAISDDGRFVAFVSAATTLVANDTNGVDDVFVHDRSTGATTRVSVATGGAQGNGHSNAADISGDGRFVAFNSRASNLVSGDTNGNADVFVHDRSTGTTTRVSVATGGAQHNAAVDTQMDPGISADGRFVAFDSSATNLVANDTNATGDVFVHDRNTGATTRVSLASGGGQGDGGSLRAAVSADGQFVAFESFASNLVTGDTNGAVDVFVHDRSTAATSRVSVATAGAQGNANSLLPAISADGQFVAFQSSATNLVTSDTNGAADIFVRSRSAGITSRASLSSGGSQANGASSTPDISADGSWVSFQSAATNLVTGDTNGNDDVFLRNRGGKGGTSRVSVGGGGAQASGGSIASRVSGDGRFVAFDSSAANLVANDTNNARDIFVRDRGLVAGFTGSWSRTRLSCARPPRCIVSGRLTIDNPGTLTAARSRVFFYLSANRRLDRRDRLVKRTSVAALRAGRTRTLRFRRVLGSRPSARYLIARLDATNRVSEPNERDNVVVSKRLRRPRR